jgi:hypothetical protein
MKQGSDHGAFWNRVKKMSGAPMIACSKASHSRVRTWRLGEMICGAVKSIKAD